MGTTATAMERQHTNTKNNTRQHTESFKMLPSHIAKVTIKSCTLYRCLRQLNAPLIKLLQWILSAQVKKYLKLAVHFVDIIYLASMVISTWLRHCLCWKYEAWFSQSQWSQYYITKVVSTQMKATNH